LGTVGRKGQASVLEPKIEFGGIDTGYSLRE